jgi:hypothetical protein
MMYEDFDNLMRLAAIAHPELTENQLAEIVYREI